MPIVSHDPEAAAKWASRSEGEQAALVERLCAETTNLAELAQHPHRNANIPDKTAATARRLFGCIRRANFEPESIDLVPLLLQTGYLTLTEQLYEDLYR